MATGALTLSTLLLLFGLTWCLPAIQDHRFLFTSGFHYRSDSALPPAPKFDYHHPSPAAFQTYPQLQQPLLAAPFLSYYQSSPAVVPTPAAPRQVSLASPPTHAAITVVSPPLFPPGIEQYKGERTYKQQRELEANPGFGVTHGTTAGKALAHLLPSGVTPVGPGGPQAQYFGAPRTRHVVDNPKYRYTQVGLTYGRRADHHHHDGGYGPFDPHGIKEYAHHTEPVLPFKRY